MVMVMVVGVEGECTSCDVKEDASAYWTPRLLVGPPNVVGKEEDEVVNAGGMPVPMKAGKSFIVYYKLIGEKGERYDNDVEVWGEIEAFPAGFRMLVSEEMVRAKSLQDGGSVYDRPVSYVCLGDGVQAYTAEFPADPTACVNGLRTQLTFPSCWDGSSGGGEGGDPSSHVAYPVGSWAGSPCPSSHPRRLPTLFYEVIYDTVRLSKDVVEKGWSLMYPGMPNQFVSSSSSSKKEPLFHGDFMNGWDQSFLRRAVSECGVTPCPLIRKDTTASTCKKQPLESSPGGDDGSSSSNDDDDADSNGTNSATGNAAGNGGGGRATWKKIWSDEFKKFDESTWTRMEGDGCEYGICGWGNGELQYYTNSPRNAYVKRGRLVIRPRYETGSDLDRLREYCRSRCASLFSSSAAELEECSGRCNGVQFSSARLSSKGAFDISPAKSGYKRIKIVTKFRLKRGSGLWPAIWMLPPSQSTAHGLPAVKLTLWRRPTTWTPVLAPSTMEEHGPGTYFMEERNHVVQTGGKKWPFTGKKDE